MLIEGITLTVLSQSDEVWTKSVEEKPLPGRARPYKADSYQVPGRVSVRGRTTSRADLVKLFSLHSAAANVTVTTDDDETFQAIIENVSAEDSVENLWDSSVQLIPVILTFSKTPGHFSAADFDDDDFDAQYA